MRKQIVEARTKDLPEDVAERLRGFNGTVKQLHINIEADGLRIYLQETYGNNRKQWLRALNQMLADTHRMKHPEYELPAVKRVIKEVDGVEVEG